MPININCVYSNNGAWCNNRNIKRSLLGFGARCCVIYPPTNIVKCKYQEMYPRPKHPPAPASIKINNETKMIEITNNYNTPEIKCDIQVEFVE